MIVLHKKKRIFGSTTIYKKKKKKIDSLIYGQFTKQNSIFTFTNLKGDVQFVVSNGMNGFQNSKAKTRFATHSTAEKVANQAYLLGYKRSMLILKGKNKGRKRCIRLLRKGGLRVRKIIDKTPIIHNGCRPLKKPRN